ncbi:MAG: phosphoglycolate phosphatase [Cellvibrionaceae bacterium]
MGSDFDISGDFNQAFDGFPKLVMFDLDGTLVDSVPDLAVATDAMLQELYGVSAGVEKVRLWVGNGASVLVRRALADVEAIAEAAVNDGQHQRALAQFLHYYRQASGQYSRLYPGAAAALARLRRSQVTLALVTNKPAEFVPHLLDDLGIAKDFKYWLGGDSLTEKKPHPAPLLELLKRSGVQASQALMVGDSRSDIEAAKAAKVASLGVSYGYNHGKPIAEESPRWITSNLDEFFAAALAAPMASLGAD